MSNLFKDTYLQSMFRNLDRLVAPDRPCAELLWLEEISTSIFLLVNGCAKLNNNGN